MDFWIPSECYLKETKGYLIRVPVNKSWKLLWNRKKQKRSGNEASDGSAYDTGTRCVDPFIETQKKPKTHLTYSRQNVTRHRERYRWPWLNYSKGMRLGISG